MSEIITVKDLNYTYLPGSAYEHQALKNISFSLDKGDFLGIFGPNGSGKSTLAQHFNGLLYPTRGLVTVCNMDTSNKKLRLELWKKVSLVFQYPEQQIFQITVYDEVAYGPRNLGISEAEVKDRVYKALQQVGLAPEYIVQLTPIRLSGGMRRRVAIAGMLALDPEILVLDEPMAGLDTLGRKLILDIIKRRHDNKETTVMISHNLKDIIALADKIAILDRGSLVFFGNIKQLLENKEILAHYRLELPEYLQVVYALADRGFSVKTNISGMIEAGQEIIKLLGQSLS